MACAVRKPMVGWAAVVTAIIILVTAWVTRRAVRVVHVETQAESEYEIRDVWVSGQERSSTCQGRVTD